MISPKLVVVTRFITADGWKDGFPINCIKYPDGSYSSIYGLEKTFREEQVYEGECPPELRMLPFVDPKYLLAHMYFYSQVVPKKIHPKIADAVRHTCPIRGFLVYDAEAYHPEGKIISTLKDGLKGDIKEFITMLLKPEDWDRIEKWDDFGIDNWSSLYSKEKC